MIKSIARKAAFLAGGMAIAALALVGGGVDRQQPVAQAQLGPCGGQDLFACITITKVTLTDRFSDDVLDSDQAFTFHASFGEGFILHNGESDVFNLLSDPGEDGFSVTEEIPEGWELVSVFCEDSSFGDFVDYDINEATGEVAIEFERGAIEVECTFYNAEVVEEEDEDDERDSGRFIGGGLFAGDMSAAERNRARANAAGAAAAAAAAPAPAASVRPPSTGDGGLR